MSSGGGRPGMQVSDGAARVVHTCAAGRGAARRGRAVRTPRAADMDLRLTRARKRGVAGAGARGVFTCGCRRRVQRAGDRSLGGAGAAPGGGGRGERAPAASPPRGRVRAVVACPAVRRAPVSPKAPGGGGEPRAARPRAHAPARSRSAPSPPPAPRAPRRRARSLAASLARPPPASPAPRLRPVFLWARQRDGTVQEVRCEDYDPRNRIRIARTPTGWRVIPRTEIFDSILVPVAPARNKPERVERRRRRRPGRPRRRRVDAAAPAPAWLAPDLESHIPSHTIAVPRAPPPPAPEPTPLDNLLAVAELEFNQQRGEEALELELQAGTAAQYPFLPEAEEVARDVMSFELGESKQPDDIFFERKTHPSERTPDEDSFQNDIAHVHKDLFETISEAHYLPELSGPHDEALIESLVEKGCEDNQIHGQSLAHLVHGSGDYPEEEDEMLLGSAPVADIIDRLEQSLESPSRSSMTAAQGLLHLHHIGDHLPPQEHQQAVEQTYMATDEFPNPDASADCTLETLTAASEMQADREVNQLEYEQNADKRLQNDIDTPDAIFTNQVPDLPESYDKKSTSDEQQIQPLPDQSELPLPSEVTLPLEPENDESATNITENVMPKVEVEDSNEGDIQKLEKLETDLDETSDGGMDGVELVATDLSKKTGEKMEKIKAVIASVAETTNSIEDNLSEKSEELPKDLSVPYRRLPTPHASPRRIDIPRAPSRESDAMQSPQPSGIPAIPSSPEIFTMPQTKSKQVAFMENLLSSTSPKMYTSEVTITKQVCEPLNLGKHRKSASPTVSSCSDEIRKINKEFGEPQEKKRRESTDDVAKIRNDFTRCEPEPEEPDDIKPEVPPRRSRSPRGHQERAPRDTEELFMSPVKQLQYLKSSSTFNMPDPLLIPKDKLNAILAAPGREIPSLLMQRPELRLPEAFAFPSILQDPDILVISVTQLENILENETKRPKERSCAPRAPSRSDQTPPPDQGIPKTIPTMDALAGDIDAATTAAFNHMLWFPYINQLSQLGQIDAMTACSQNMEFLKALNASGYSGPNYPDLSLINPAARLSMGPTGFPMVPPMDYENRMQFALWQEAMNNANASQQQRNKVNSAMEAQMKEIVSKSSDVQNPYVHSTKNHHSKSHNNMSSRSSPMAANYNATAAAVANQRATSLHNHPFLQNMYPGINPNIRSNMPIPGVQIPPYFNPNMMGRDQRSPRNSGQQKSPSSPFYPNNNYLQSVQSKHNTASLESQSHPQRSNSTGSHQSTESPRPRISVKSLHNLLEPTAVAAVSGSHGQSRRGSTPTAVTSVTMNRRRDEPEVGSTTPLGETTGILPPHPHDPASFHLWHPLFGNQKSYNSPWSWTTVTATGD